MDLRKVRKLIEIFNTSKLSEIEIREGEESIRLTRTPTITQAPYAVPEVQPAVSPAPGGSQFDEQEDSDTFAVESPMVGTFFASASPDDSPFVSVGDSVSVGDPLCLIEAMKIFNQIEAEQSGTIVRILKQDHDPVEFGEPIFLLRE
ncbi:MAG: acetyl-CoA carboxylase biotin carboxyl carrier protein [Acidiferrobacterales bacterium]|nr:acetyl-CoA carboxylase biotin carboxyl carrier protein [Acidiferrobacterales bacterium]